MINNANSSAILNLYNFSFFCCINFNLTSRIESSSILSLE